jgi:predicted house-cleaning noncanonical NTP pyrophosphatase (MazG superfamily)
MTQIHRFRVGKLVRNKTYERLKSRAVKMKFRIASSSEYHDLLKTKLIEEAEEVALSTTDAELISELADVLEVIHAIAVAHTVSFEAIEAKRQEKLVSRGGFDHQIYSEYIEMDESHELYVECKNEPAKYPEIEIKALPEK